MQKGGSEGAGDGRLELLEACEHSKRLTVCPVESMARLEQLVELISRRPPSALRAALECLDELPDHSGFLLLAVVAALLDEQPAPAAYHLRRFRRRFLPHGLEAELLEAVVLAHKGAWVRARYILQKHGIPALVEAIHHIPCNSELEAWFIRWIMKIATMKEPVAASNASSGKRTGGKRTGGKRTGRSRTGGQRSERGGRLRLERSKTKAAKQARDAGQASRAAGTSVRTADEKSSSDTSSAPPVEEELAPLPRHRFPIPVTLTPPDGFSNPLASSPGDRTPSSSPPEPALDPASLELFALRYELGQLSLLQGFDELLCLATLRDVDTYWYQVETVRRVLKQFRGRVLLADEVGLGKTIEAGMVLKEYLLRGMVERVLVLTPATLVGQWSDEMARKFDVPFASTYDPLLRHDAGAFWSQPRVIASTATARRAEHRTVIEKQRYDLVIVDEAHRLKNRSTASWKLVNALHRQFLLLLSATPVQNSLVELYNLLTLLKPGIFQTEKEFRARYVTRGKPRIPAHRDSMRDLMRDVMIRNTRASVDVRLSPRHATTICVDPSPEEAACYQTLDRLVQQARRTATRRLALRHLLSAAGSTAATATAAIERYLASPSATHGGDDGDGGDEGDKWRALHARYGSIERTSKERAFIDLLARNPDEKKIVFVHHRETLKRLDQLLDHARVAHGVFEGGLSGPDKDRAIERFRDEVPVLLCTESGGEGRNLQFCNTLINFDLPWNPMVIEQRIGRLHRIGQTRDVFIFNLVMRGTLEEQVLRILDEKINMFELVVGEVDSILGELSEDGDFAELIFCAWVENTDASRPAALTELGDRLVEARSQYEAVKVLDDELFGEEFLAS